MMRTIKFAAISAVFALSSLGAQAAPITYSFSTDSVAFGSGPLAPLFNGFAVTGTFDFDPATPPFAIIPGGRIAGSTLYLGTTSNLSGTVRGETFTDPNGRTIVGDDKFDGVNDFLTLNADANLDSGAPPAAFDLDGFDIAGFSLVNVRMFWIEGLTVGTGDFLSSQDLPDPLPGIEGRLALDFIPAGTTDPVFTRVFYDGLTVSRVAVTAPSTLALLALGLLGLALGRRRIA